MEQPLPAGFAIATLTDVDAFIKMVHENKGLLDASPMMISGWFFCLKGISEVRALTPTDFTQRVPDAEIRTILAILFQLCPALQRQEKPAEEAGTMLLGNVSA